MIDPRSSDIAGIGRRADDGSPPGMPRWVKVVGLVMVVVALVLHPPSPKLARSC